MAGQGITPTARCLHPGTSFACIPPQRQRMRRPCSRLGRVSASRQTGAAHRSARPFADLPHHLVRRRIGRIFLRAPVGAPQNVTQAVAAPQPKPLPGCALHTLARTGPRNPTGEPSLGVRSCAKRPLLSAKEHALHVGTTRPEGVTAELGMTRARLGAAPDTLHRQQLAGALGHPQVPHGLCGRLGEAFAGRAQRRLQLLLRCSHWPKRSVQAGPCP